MNKKVLKTLIYLCWGFLIAYAILKCVPAIAEKFIIVVNNEKIVQAGNYITNHKWLYYSCHFITTCLVYQFYLCACCRKWYLTLKEYIISLVFIIIAFVINYFNAYVGTVISYLVMFILPFVLKAQYKDVVIIFTAHTLGQLAITFIRSQPINMADVNFLTQLICCLDMYVWLLLYYIYSNIYKESIIMGTLAPPLWGKMDKQIKQEIESLDKKIATCTDDDKLAKLKAKKVEYEKMLETSDEK